MRAATIAAAAALLSGCTTIDTHTPPPAGWPDLLVIELRMSPWEVAQRCNRYVPWYMRPALACAEINLIERTCTVPLPDDAGAELLREHEHLHCRGHDHPGDSTLRDAFHAYTGARAGEAAAAFRP